MMLSQFRFEASHFVTESRCDKFVEFERYGCVSDREGREPFNEGLMEDAVKCRKIQCFGA